MKNNSKLYQQLPMRAFKTFCLLCLLASVQVLNAASVAYIYGDVAADGTVPSGSAEPYDQMLLTDMGRTGLSRFKSLVESQGHTINQFYDQDTSLTTAFLAGKDLVIFGLHQKIWSSTERTVLNAWLQAGGGMFIYSDSASGGRFNIVGAQNPVGQGVTNNLIAPYGMQVTVDQADGTTAQTASSTASIAALRSRRLEGEGVSPVAISQSNTNVEILIPYNRAGNKRQNLTITNPRFASLALRPVGAGHIAVMFDRQPMWNSGPGSDITKRDNEFILRTMVNFLVSRPSITPTNPQTPRPNGDVLIAPIVQLLLE